MNMREILIAFALKYNGDVERVFDAIKRKEEINPKEWINDLNCNVVTIVDDNYPDYFKTIPLPPICLFYECDKLLIDDMVEWKMLDNGRIYTSFTFGEKKEFIDMELYAYFESLDDMKTFKKRINDFKR